MSTSASTFWIISRSSYARPWSRSTTGHPHGLLLAAWLLACACGGAPHRGPSPATVALLEQAESAESRRRYDRARALYLQAKREAPDDVSRARAARAFGRALIFWGEYAGARVELTEATRLAPDDAGAWHDLGIVNHHDGDLPGAESAFRRSIRARPRDPRSRIALAALLWQTGRHRDALTEYQALLTLEVPPRIRDKVEWAIRALQARLAGDAAPSPDPPSPGGR